MDFGKLLGGADIDKLTKLLELAKDLPDMLGSFAESLEAAGGEARKAGLAIVGDGADGGASAKVASGATSLGSIADLIGSVADAVSDATGDIKKVPLMDGPADKLGSAAASLKKTTNDLGGLADDLSGLAEILTSVGKALAKLGDHLDGSSVTAKSFAAKVD